MILISDFLNASKHTQILGAVVNYFWNFFYFLFINNNNNSNKTHFNKTRLCEKNILKKSICIKFSRNYVYKRN